MARGGYRPRSTSIRIPTASAELAVAAVRRAVQNLARAGRPCEEHAVAPETRERLERFRREGAGRGRGQAAAIHWEEADRMCERAEADRDLHGLRDAALIGVASHGLLRDSEVSALEAGGVNAGPLFRPVVRGEASEARLGPASVCPAIKRRAKEAGIASRVSAHSLRVGAAQSLAERGGGGVAGGASGSRPLEVAGDAGALRARPGGRPGGGGAASWPEAKKAEKSACARQCAQTRIAPGHRRRRRGQGAVPRKASHLASYWLRVQ